MSSTYGPSVPETRVQIISQFIHESGISWASVQVARVDHFIRLVGSCNSFVVIAKVRALHCSSGEKREAAKSGVIDQLWVLVQLVEWQCGKEKDEPELETRTMCTRSRDCQTHTRMQSEPMPVRLCPAADSCRFCFFLGRSRRSLWQCGVMTTQGGSSAPSSCCLETRT